MLGYMSFRWKIILILGLAVMPEIAGFKNLKVCGFYVKKRPFCHFIIEKAPFKVFIRSWYKISGDSPAHP